MAIDAKSFLHNGLRLFDGLRGQVNVIYLKREIALGCCLTSTDYEWGIIDKTFHSNSGTYHSSTQQSFLKKRSSSDNQTHSKILQNNQAELPGKCSIHNCVLTAWNNHCDRVCCKGFTCVLRQQQASDRAQRPDSGNWNALFWVHYMIIAQKQRTE